MVPKKEHCAAPGAAFLLSEIFQFLETSFTAGDRWRSSFGGCFFPHARGGGKKTLEVWASCVNWERSLTTEHEMLYWCILLFIHTQETQVPITETLPFLHLEHYSQSGRSVTEDTNALLDHFHVFTIHFLLPQHTGLAVTSESLCLCIALSQEGEEENAYGSACTLAGHLCFHSRTLCAADKNPFLIRHKNVSGCTH